MNLRTCLIFLAIVFFPSLVSSSSEEKVDIQLDNSVVLKLIRNKFNIADRQIVYKNYADKTITLIDNYLVFGTDATIPTSELTSATLVLEEIVLACRLMVCMIHGFRINRMRALFNLATYTMTYIG